jgi:acyl dehydratase
MADELQVGDTHEVVLVDNLTRTQIVQYAGASGDYNPLHTDEVFATQVAGYPTVFAHGMLTMGMTGRLLTGWLGAENLTSYGSRFVAQVWPGDTLTGRATVEAIRDEGDARYADVSIVTTNQRGETVLMGTASARLPSSPTSA